MKCSNANLILYGLQEKSVRILGCNHLSFCGRALQWEIEVEEYGGKQREREMIFHQITANMMQLQNFTIFSLND